METVDLYLDAPEGLEAFAKVLAPILGLPVTPGSDGYQFGGPEVVGWLDAHELVKDGDLDFPAFPLDVAFRARSAEFAGARDRLARNVFEALKATGQYPVMLVFDDQRRLDEFHPAPAIVRRVG